MSPSLGSCWASIGRRFLPGDRPVTSPRTANLTLRLLNGSRVRWTVLQHQADRALAFLGFADRAKSET